MKKIDKSIKSGGKIKDCLVKSLLFEKDKESLDELDITMLASTFMIGGWETTASVIQWFAAVMPVNPRIQELAQEELDRVVGRHRLPTIEDETSLPYCRAIVKELERCYNPAWLGTPHMASQDFFYGQYLIPKGTVVVLNTWTMHHDPSRWESPNLFIRRLRPERYIHDSHRSSTSASLPNPPNRDHWIFGAGRRICPGMNLAEQEIWLAISRMLWAFEMMPIPDKPINLDEYDGLSGRSPGRFEISLKPRFNGVRKVLEREKERWRVQVQ